MVGFTEVDTLKHHFHGSPVVVHEAENLCPQSQGIGSKPFGGVARLDIPLHGISGSEGPGIIVTLNSFHTAYRCIGEVEQRGSGRNAHALKSRDILP